ncbi:MAG TPA: 4-hydroxy-3-methylbut-2-enyl diphosphate reductase [Candidatus Bathyarchaeia archaeon]|nr:4-hydroxy-3-methylbut-2-enyl diphosphate reductase [Candidatus Bathyarchaeia archaeon]
MDRKKIFLARIQGFCSGVATAIEIVERAIQKYGTPLYVYHEIVHNTFVVERFRQAGVIFIEDLERAPVGSRVIFSAHGVSPAIMDVARRRGLKYIDATCPLVKKVHSEAVRFAQEGRHVILIGHKGHQEIVGTSGYVDETLLHIVQNAKDIALLHLPSSTPVAYVTQTTLSVDEAVECIAHLRQRFIDIKGPAKDDICYATQNRQDAVKELAQFCDVILICGSPTSSNSNRLCETGKRAGVDSYIIDCADELDPAWLNGKGHIGISSGASVPEYVVKDLVKRIQTLFPGSTVERVGESKEPRIFPLPEI